MGRGGEEEEERKREDDEWCGGRRVDRGRGRSGGRGYCSVSRRRRSEE